MAKTLSLRDANQSFARCIREVEAGEEVIVTRNGKPVARIVPASRKRVLTPEQEAAWQSLEAEMNHGWRLGGAFERDELYER